MSWWDTKHLTSYASQALKSAQKKIDKVLDIKEEDSQTEIQLPSLDEIQDGNISKWILGEDSKTSSKSPTSSSNSKSLYILSPNQSPSSLPSPKPERPSKPASKSQKQLQNLSSDGSHNDEFLLNDLADCLKEDNSTTKMNLKKTKNLMGSSKSAFRKVKQDTSPNILQTEDQDLNKEFNDYEKVSNFYGNEKLKTQFNETSTGLITDNNDSLMKLEVENKEIHNDVKNSQNGENQDIKNIQDTDDGLSKQKVEGKVGWINEGLQMNEVSSEMKMSSCWSEGSLGSFQFDETDKDDERDDGVGKKKDEKDNIDKGNKFDEDANKNLKVKTFLLNNIENENEINVHKLEKNNKQNSGKEVRKESMGDDEKKVDNINKCDKTKSWKDIKTHYGEINKGDNNEINAPNIDSHKASVSKSEMVKLDSSFLGVYDEKEDKREVIRDNDDVQNNKKAGLLIYLSDDSVEQERNKSSSKDSNQSQTEHFNFKSETKLNQIDKKKLKKSKLDTHQHLETIDYNTAETATICPTTTTQNESLSTKTNETTISFSSVNQTTITTLLSLPPSLSSSSSSSSSSTATNETLQASTEHQHLQTTEVTQQQQLQQQHTTIDNSNNSIDDDSTTTKFLSFNNSTTESRESANQEDTTASFTINSLHSSIELSDVLMTLNNKTTMKQSNTTISATNDEGGNDEGGNDEGGNDEGGNDEGGNDEGGNDEGGNDEGGNDNDGGNNDGVYNEENDKKYEFVDDPNQIKGEASRLFGQDADEECMDRTTNHPDNYPYNHSDKHPDNHRKKQTYKNSQIESSEQLNIITNDENVTTTTTSLPSPSTQFPPQQTTSPPISSDHPSTPQQTLSSPNTSDHTSADEVDTTTSSDIEIISQISTPSFLGNPVGCHGNKQTSSRCSNDVLSPSNQAVANNTHDNQGNKRKDEGERRWDEGRSSENGEDFVNVDFNRGGYVEVSHRKRNDDSSQSAQLARENDNLMKKLSHVMEVLDVREMKVLELTGDNIELKEDRDIIQSQLNDMKACMQTDKEDVKGISLELSAKISVIEKQLLQTIKENEILKKTLQEIEMRRRSDNLSYDKVIEEKEETISELLSEGEKLSKQQLHSNNNLKKLRLKEKEAETIIKNLKLKVEEQKVKILNFEEVISGLIQSDKNQLETINQLNSLGITNQEIIKQLKNELEDSHAKASSFKAALNNSYKEMSELQKRRMLELGEAQRTACKMEAIERMEDEMMEERRRGKKVEGQLLGQLEDLRIVMSRRERDEARREAGLKEEISDLQRRLQESEEKNQHMSESVSTATRPLLRQIETIQSTHTTQAYNFEQIERSLSDRLVETQNQLVVSMEKERDALDKLNNLNSKMASSDVQLSFLRQDKADLQVEMESYVSKMTSLKEETHLMTAQKNSLVKSMQQELNACKREKLLMEERLEGEVSRVEGEKKKVEMLRGQLKHQESQQRTQLTLKKSSDVSLHSTPSSTPIHPSTPSTVTPSTTPIPPSTPTSIDPFNKSSYRSYSRQSVYDSSRGMVGTSLVENLQSLLKMRASEINQLQGEIEEVEQSRASMADQVVNLTLKNEHLQGEVEELNKVKQLYEEVDGRYNALLQMYGEKEEQVQELRMDLIEFKEIYKQQMNEVLRIRSQGIP